MFNIIQPGSNEFFFVGSAPNLEPTFDAVSSVKGGTINLETETYANLTGIIQQDARDYIGAIAWNPSTRECWTAGAFSGEIRKYDEWLLNFRDGGQLVGSVVGNPSIYGGCHIGGNATPGTRNDIINTFLVIVNHTKLVAIDMLTGSQSVWYDLDDNSEHSFESFREVCPLAKRGAGPAHGACIIGNRLGGRSFIAEIWGPNQVRVWDTLAEPTPVENGMVYEKFYGPWNSGGFVVTVSKEIQTDLDYFEEIEGHPLGGIQYTIQTGRCEIITFRRREGGGSDGTSTLCSYTIPTEPNEVEDYNEFDGYYTVLIERYRIGGPAKTWSDTPENIGQVMRLIHFREGVGFFLIRPQNQGQGLSDPLNLLPDFADESGSQFPYIYGLWVRTIESVYGTVGSSQFGTLYNQVAIGPGATQWYML